MAVHLVTQSKATISTLGLKLQLGVSYNTVRPMRHKILQAMKSYNETQSISGTVQLADAYGW